MKQTFAVVVMLAALGVLLKLSGPKAPFPDRPLVPVQGTDSERVQDDPEQILLEKYPDDRDLTERVLRRYRQTALTIERTDGLRGLTLLDKLDLEAIYLYEQHPNDFRRLRDTLNDEAAAELLLHWREYFGLKRADTTDRKLLIAEISRLSNRQRQFAARYPHALPLILTDPVGMTELIARWEDEPERLQDALIVLDFIDLEPGSSDLRAAVRTLDRYGALALDAFRLQGLDGFATVHLYGPVLVALQEALPLDQALILLRVNSDFVDDQLRTHPPETLARYLRHVGAIGLVEEIGSSPHALRLVVAYGEAGERALAQAGPDAADLVFEDYSDPVLRNQAVLALGEHGTMALAMLAKYSIDPDFREILRRYGPDVIPPVARSDTSPELLAVLKAKPERSFTEWVALGVTQLSNDSGQGTIQRIKDEGIDRVVALETPHSKFYEYLPLYDVLHLGDVMRKGYSPTKGEMAWALIDGCFIVVDALSLLALQPQGVVASELGRAEVKTAAKVSVKTLGRELTENGTESAGRALGRRTSGELSGAATERLSRWWTVRSAGGTYQVLRRYPEALERLTVGEIATLGRPFCERAGLRLRHWVPKGFVRNGEIVKPALPAGRGLKYLAAQSLQVGVGVVAFHKMEEHMASRHHSRD